MAFKTILLLLPVLALARIDMKISGTFAEDRSSLNVDYSGNQVDLISDEEVHTFHLGEENVMVGVKEYFKRRPDNAFLHSPTLWSDLYKTYSWSEVMRSLTPRNGRILKISSMSQVVKTQIFENTSPEKAFVDVAVSTELNNTASSRWSRWKGGNLSINQEIYHDFDVKASNCSFKMSYAAPWSRNSVKSQTVTIGRSSGLKRLLTPGQLVTSKIHVTKVIMKVELEYVASLTGSVAVNYKEIFKGHHFWALDVAAVMKSRHLNNKLKSREIIVIEFYLNPRIVVKDNRTDLILIDTKV